MLKAATDSWTPASEQWYPNDQIMYASAEVSASYIWDTSTGKKAESYPSDYEDLFKDDKYVIITPVSEKS